MQRAVDNPSTAWALPVSSLTIANEGRQRKYLGIPKRAMRKELYPQRGA